MQHFEDLNCPFCSNVFPQEIKQKIKTPLLFMIFLIKARLRPPEIFITFLFYFCTVRFYLEYSTNFCRDSLGSLNSKMPMGLVNFKKGRYPSRIDLSRRRQVLREVVKWCKFSTSFRTRCAKLQTWQSLSE